jgi:hypothetical protein
LQKAQSRPLPELIEGSPEYEVEDILNHGKTGRRGHQTWKFRVKWRGYPVTEATWEPIENLLPNAKTKLDAYKAKYPNDFPPPSRQVRFLEFPRSSFPPDFFDKHSSPSTSGIDNSLPSENLLARLTHSYPKSSQARNVKRGVMS